MNITINNDQSSGVTITKVEVNGVPVPIQPIPAGGSVNINVPGETCKVAVFYDDGGLEVRLERIAPMTCSSYTATLSKANGSTIVVFH
jgi:hypothetical protein